jgi:small GTP-binding protein
MTKFGEIETTMPTIGFNLETVSYKNVTLTAWDFGGRTPMRPLWCYYYKTASGFIFVIDSNDRYLVDDSCTELHRMANEEDLKTKPILIFANKQDLPNALPLDVIKERLQLSKLDEMNTQWHVQVSSAINNEWF